MKLKALWQPNSVTFSLAILVAAFTANSALGEESAALRGAPVVMHISPAGADGNPGTLDKPIRSFDRLRQRLAELPRVTEVVFHGGTYRGGLMLDSLKDVDPAQTPLLLRAAPGAEVLFDGAGELSSPTLGGPRNAATATTLSWARQSRC